jgi:hypothetical protein
LNLAAVMQMHFRAQALWKTPPATGRILLRRLEYILGHTIVDDSPDTVFAWPKSRAASEPKRCRRRSQAWEPDRSGYDGWLRGPGRHRG